ncbi:MAG: alcohol dehydrogenase [Polyangiaceae bacterium UTPRO1]|nr:zinc-binding dehydrogenase [Myxococcales bacterium]OQY64557.1 MAG: alcohol dehydrogenase [Polyangiaceae bacterium UTPRO1]
MRAVVCRNAELRVVDRPEPQPGARQVLLGVLRCGICGSDLHARKYCDHLVPLMEKAGFRGFMTSQDEVVFGHELCGEVLEHGPGCDRKVRSGTRVCALPFLRRDGGIDALGLSPRSPGAYAERVVVEESMMVPVPNGLSSDLAALTEPMAVAWHAVRRGEVAKRDVAVVIGCGPVGLAVVCVLKARGVKTIIASDFSAGRRQLAEQCGAHVVIDPAQRSPFASWAEYGFIDGLPGALELAMGTREKLGKLPLPWWQVWRVAEAAGFVPKRPIVFECVGVPGVIQGIVDGAPLFSRVVVAGVCMQRDEIEPALAVNKEIDLRFALGYSPLEYRDALQMIAQGRIRCAPLLTGLVGLDGVDDAFEALGDPETHAKILIDPQSPATRPVPLRTAEQR